MKEWSNLLKNQDWNGLKLQTDQNNDVKVNQRKYRKARISRSPIHSEDINAIEDILSSVVFSESLKTVLKQILGDDVYLLNEQYIIKPPLNYPINETKNSQGVEEHVFSGIVTMIHWKMYVEIHCIRRICMGSFG